MSFSPNQITHAQYIAMKPETQMTPLQIKVELLETSIEETQKYALLTTNQYIQQMELVVEILEEISVWVDARSSI